MKNLAIKQAHKRAQPDKNSDTEDEVSDGGEAPGTAVAFWSGLPGRNLREVKREHKRLFPNTGIIDSIMRITATFSTSNSPNVPLVRNSSRHVKFYILFISGGHRREDDEDTVLQPPHLALSSKRLAESDEDVQPENFESIMVHQRHHVLQHTHRVLQHTIEFCRHPSSLRQRSSPPPLSTGRGQPRTYHTESSASDMPSDIFSLNSKGHTQEEEELGLQSRSHLASGPDPAHFSQFLMNTRNWSVELPPMYGIIPFSEIQCSMQRKSNNYYL
ncbi:hypothetical protein BGX38DRAFT_1274366 [Terfezia claveryi]|nr:hypothetical protein BGX38DRAFT_1274366 [Terfezia claveryi]